MRAVNKKNKYCLASICEYKRCQKDFGYEVFLKVYFVKSKKFRGTSYTEKSVLILCSCHYL